MRSLFLVNMVCKVRSRQIWSAQTSYFLYKHHHEPECIGHLSSILYMTQKNKYQPICIWQPSIRPVPFYEAKSLWWWRGNRPIPPRVPEPCTPEAIKSPLTFSSIKNNYKCIAQAGLELEIWTFYFGFKWFLDCRIQSIYYTGISS